MTSSQVSDGEDQEHDAYAEAKGYGQEATNVLNQEARRQLTSCSHDCCK